MEKRTPADEANNTYIEDRMKQIEAILEDVKTQIYDDLSEGDSHGNTNFSVIKNTLDFIETMYEEESEVTNED
jgi:hypothetical protein